MARVCELNGTRPTTGNQVSHSNIKTRTRWLPNLSDKRYLIPELKQIVSLTLSTRAIRTIDKQGGITKALIQAKPENLSPRMLKLRNQVIKFRKKAAAPKTAAKAKKA